MILEIRIDKFSDNPSHVTNIYDVDCLPKGLVFGNNEHNDETWVAKEVIFGRHMLYVDVAKYLKKHPNSKAVPAIKKYLLNKYIPKL